MLNPREQRSVAPEDNQTFESNYATHLYASLMSLQNHCKEQGFDSTFMELWNTESMELYNYWIQIYQQLCEDDCCDLPDETIKLLPSCGENPNRDHAIIRRESDREITEVTVYTGHEQEGEMHIATIFFTDSNRLNNDSVDIHLKKNKISRWNITKAYLPNQIPGIYPIPITINQSMDLSKHI